MKKTLCLLLSLVMVTSTLVFAQAATTETATVLYSFDAVYDSASPVESAFNTNFAVEQIHTEGTGSTWMNFAIPTGQASSIGGMLFVNFATARDYSAYDTFKLDIYTPATMNGAGGMLQFNFMSDPAMQDGYNYNIDINHLTAGWNTVIFKKANYAAHANNANWSSIRRYRITWFNYSQITNVPFMCLDNLRGIVTTHTCTSSSGYKSDGSTHWTNCTECGEVMTQGSHSGGTATCTAAAKCSTCGASYGSKNASNHTGGTEIRNAKAATCGATGYTGDTHCKGCGAKTKSGSTIAATGAHTGGTATCIAKAKCSTCGTSYGNLNTSNHTGGTEVRNAKSATCGAAGYTGDTYCKGCGVKTKNGSTIAATGNHTGGTATCTGQKKCSVCGIAYGTTNGSNHTGGTEVRNAKAATCGVAGYSGDTYCKSCGAITAKGSTIAATGKHTGGTATCNAKAKCSTCGLAYGSVNASNHVGGTELRNESATYTGDTYCLGCSTVLTKGFAIDGSGVIHSFDAIYDSSCPVSSAFNTDVAIESNAKTEGTGSTRLGFNIPVGQDSGIGGMIFIDFATAKDLTAYQQFKIDVYTPLSMQGVGGFLQINFVSDSALQDGYNYNVSISNIVTGWNTLTFDKNSFVTHANSANWASIKRIRITWFNQAQISREFVLLDNLRGSYAAHQHTAAGSIQYDATYHWYNCSTVGCGNLVNKGVHSGGTATCTAKAKCSTCGYSYGSVNSSNHAGGTEVRGATTAGCGSAGYTGDTYCLGCGVKTKTGTTISATSQHTGGTATCVAAAKCTVCGNSYGSVNSSNHVNTEVRNASATYSGDTWCKDCNTKLKTGTSLIAATAHAPYAVGRDLMINNADSLDGWEGALFNTTINKGTQIKEGSGSVAMTATVPVGQASNIGAMTKVSFPAVDLSSYGTIRYKIHFSHALSGTHQFQTNLITGNGGDGYNHVFTFTDFTAGWHTFEFKISDFSAAAAADLKSINAIRFTWFNAQQVNTAATFTIDEIMALAPIGHAPYKVGSDLMINNADSTDGWIPDMFNTKIVSGAYKTEGNGSVSMNSTIPVGQSSSIGAMTKVVFPATDLSSYDKIRFKMHVSHKLTNAHQIQINFITGDGGDGYNHIITVADLAAGWHTVTIDRASIPQAVAANWSSINAIRFTWFNSEQITSKVEFIFDEIMAFVESDHSHTPTGSIKYDATNHWYDCAVIGCGNLVNMAPHSGGTATCVAAAKCSTCGYVYTGLSTTNHTGGTEVRDAKAATCAATGYTGDTYCKGCGAKTKAGSTIAATGAHTGGEATCVATATCTTCGQSYGSVNANNHKNTEIRNASATYTGDTYCKDCGVKIATGAAITVNSAHTPYAVGANLMINNADSTNGWTPDMFNTSISAGTVVKEGSGSVAVTAKIPVGQASSIGAMTKLTFPTTDLTPYGAIRIKVHFSHALPGTHQLQFNFITGEGGDGFNQIYTFTDYAAGWHEFTIDRATVPMAATASWSSINAIRFTWFNAQQSNVAATFTIDEIMAVVSIGHSPYAVGSDLMINNADSTNGWEDSLFNTTISKGTQISEGSGSVTFNSTIPVGQASNIGAMTKVNFPASNLTGYEKIRFKMYFSHKMSGTHQLQVNFITGDGGDGYNHVFTFTDYEAGWHEFIIDRASVAMAATADWASINAIRFTWFNLQQVNTTMSFTVDEIMALVTTSHNHSATGNIQYNETSHWYNCATIGCGVLVNQAAHSGGTATCNAKAKCSVCGYAYGGTNASNHAGGTEVRNASATYTGDTYCLGCGVKTATGSAITPPVTGSAHTPYKVGTDLMINNADSTAGWDAALFNTTITTGSLVDEGTGSVAVNATVPVGQASSIGAMTKINFASTDLSSYEKFSFRMHVSHTLTGAHQLQFNFITGSGGDGYNYTITVADLTAGWHTVAINKNDIPMAATANWASINAIRFTWFNSQQIPTNVTFTFDKIMALAPGGHAPYVVGNNLMINNADSTSGWIPDMFNTSISAGTQIAEGSGSVTATAKVPVGQASSIGAMTKITFPAADLSSYGKISVKVYFSQKLTGTHQLQVNFITGEGGDGYNTVFTFTDYEAGWHEFIIDRASVAMAATANWASINAIRFTWFNLEQANIPMSFTFDSIMALPAGAHAPYAVGENLMIHNADSTEGWAGFMHTSIYEGTQVSEGTGSVTMDPLYPYGQDGYIGAMSKITFPATDLSSYKTITYDFYISDDLYGVHQFQTNFITGDGGDGYNYVYTFRDMAAGWHTMTIDMATVPKAASTNATWTSINAIRFTWFNLEPIPTAVKFTFDNIMALKDAHQCKAGPYIHYNDENHWYDCTTEGCALLVNEEPHYGGEATCIDRAYCAYCVKVQYGEIDPNNHVNTELLNESASYTGDLYCYDCEKTVKKGTAITKTEATATVATVKGSFKAGDKIAIPVTITEWSNSYAYITVSVPEYNTSLLRFDGFEESDTGFQGAMVDYGNNGFVLIAAPSTSSAASKLRGGEICILNFTALAELRAPVAVSVEVEANGYAYGAEDEWTTDRSLLVETKAGGTVFDDTTKPSVSIGSVTNHASSSQSLVLNFTDNGSIAGYYIGTSSTYLNNTYVATTSFIANYTVSAAGKYYINVVDASGNVSSAATVTFYMITLNANGGTVDTSKVLVKAGSTITLPTATKDNYKFSGWATTSSATTGATSITVNSNATYYAVWKNAIYGDSTGDAIITSVDALYVLQAVVGTRTLTAEQIAYCDVNGDGVITSVDALHILQKAVGKRTSFDVEGK